MAAFITGKNSEDEAEQDDITEQPTEPIPIQVPVPPLHEMIRRLQMQRPQVDALGVCVLCMLTYESQFGRPVDGEDYDSNHLEICQWHIQLIMMARDEELDLMRAQVEMAYQRYRPPH